MNTDLSPLGGTFPLDIAGQPYSLRVLSTIERRPGGYGITANGTPSDHFYRSYLVNAWEDGRPKNCSCPYCQYGDHWCKHLQAVEKWWKENTEEGRLYEEALKAQAASMGLETL